MPFDEADGLVEPLRVVREALQFASRKPLPRILRRLAQGLEMAGAHQHGQEVERPAEEARGFFSADAGRQSLSVSLALRTGNKWAIHD